MAPFVALLALPRPVLMAVVAVAVDNDAMSLKTTKKTTTMTTMTTMTNLREMLCLHRIFHGTSDGQL